MDNDRIIFDIMNMLGLEERQGRVYDQDTDSFLIYNGGFLTVGPTITLHKKDTRFDPIHNVKLTEYLMNVLFSKETRDNGMYVYSFGLSDYTNPVTLLKTFVCNITTNNGTIMSESYYNCNLAYIDCMYQISNTFKTDLHYADYTEKELFERMNKK